MRCARTHYEPIVRATIVRAHRAQAYGASVRTVSESQTPFVCMSSASNEGSRGCVHCAAPARTRNQSVLIESLNKDIGTAILRSSAPPLESLADCRICRADQTHCPNLELVVAPLLPALCCQSARLKSSGKVEARMMQTEADASGNDGQTSGGRGPREPHNSGRRMAGVDALVVGSDDGQIKRTTHTNSHSTHCAAC